eukprot:03122.XXX_37477_38621_1 [CDS] Oithona nana genome sequencing.
MTLEDQVTDSLFAFLHEHVQELKKEDIDEIVLSYVVSILQDLADMSDEESFDVDAFVETIVAYMPVTEVIPADEITEWMFALAKEQREKNARKNKHQIDLKSVIEETIQKSQQQRKISESNSIEMNLETTDKKSGSRISESSDPDPDCTYLEQSDEQVDQLMEMFPSVCTSEISHCLNLMSGDIEKAAQLIIHRQESGQCLQQKQDRVKSKFGRKNGQKQPDDKSIKRGIMDKYGFVDQADDERYHRPTLKREDDKKMIRYRDGKIVSTKGERYTQVTKAESEEMRKSYVNNS